MRKRPRTDERPEERERERKKRVNSQSLINDEINSGSFRPPLLFSPQEEKFQIQGKKSLQPEDQSDSRLSKKVLAILKKKFE